MILKFLKIPKCYNCFKFTLSKKLAQKTTLDRSVNSNVDIAKMVTNVTT